jgi:hypothetical protein
MNRFARAIKAFSALCLSTSSTVIEIDLLDGQFVLPYTIVGGSGDRLTAPIQMHFYETEGAEEAAERDYWAISTIDDTTLIMPSLLMDNGQLSLFSNDVASHYMLIPSLRQLVINPSNPRDFVYGGFMKTTKSRRNEFPQVSVSMFIPDTEEEEDIEIVLPLSSSEARYEFAFDIRLEADYIPTKKMDALLSEIERRGIRCFPKYHPDDRIEEIEIHMDEDIESLPTIQYRIQTDSGTDAAINIYGRDYVGPVIESRRKLNFKTFPFWSMMGIFGQTTLSQSALFLDNRDKTIGFGSPL